MNGSVWSKIFRTIFNMPSCQKYPGEGLIFYHDIGIGFVILKVDIKPGLKILDQRIFQEKSVLLGIDDCKFNMVYPAYKLMGFVAGKVFKKIRAYAFAKIFCFANV